MRKIAFLFTAVLFAACSEKPVLNTVDQNKVGKIKSVLILGNSIVIHGPKADIGWTGNWGMAASCPDSDFVHRLTHSIHLKDSTVEIKFKNIADYEQSFPSYPLSNFDSLRGKYDMIVMRISENVNQGKATDSNFIKHYNDLIQYLNPQSKALMVIVDGFWDHKEVNKMIKVYAVANHLPFIKNSDLETIEGADAAGKFKNKAVAAHPSDAGMKLIFERIWDYIKNYF